MHARRDQSGFSLVEVIITATLLVIMVYAVGTLMISGTEAQEYARRLNRVTEINQDTLDEMRLDLISSVKLFGNDADGLAHYNVLELSSFPTPLSTSRLPSVNPTGAIQKDTVGNEQTGNALFYARHAWTDHFRCTSGNEYLTDVYRWVLYYLTPENPGPQPGNPTGLNLIRFVSEPLVDGAQVDKITDVTDQEEVLLHLVNQTPDIDGLVHDAVQVVWLRGQDPSLLGTFRQINDSDGSLSDTPLLGRPNPWRILPNGDPVRGLLSYRHHSVATNYAISAMGVGRFAVVDNTGAGFPHGFEIQAVGPSAARQVLVHLVLATTNRRGQRAWSDMQTLVDARDL